MVPEDNILGCRGTAESRRVNVAGQRGSLSIAEGEMIDGQRYSCRGTLSICLRQKNLGAYKAGNTTCVTRMGPPPSSTMAQQQRERQEENKRQAAKSNARIKKRKRLSSAIASKSGPGKITRKEMNELVNVWRRRSSIRQKQNEIYSDFDSVEGPALQQLEAIALGENPAAPSGPSPTSSVPDLRGLQGGGVQQLAPSSGPEQRTIAGTTAPPASLSTFMCGVPPNQYSCPVSIDAAKPIAAPAPQTGNDPNSFVRSGGGNAPPSVELTPRQQERAKKKADEAIAKAIEEESRDAAKSTVHGGRTSYPVRLLLAFPAERADGAQMETVVITGFVSIIELCGIIRCTISCSLCRLLALRCLTSSI